MAGALCLELLLLGSRVANHLSPLAIKIKILSPLKGKGEAKERRRRRRRRAQKQNLKPPSAKCSGCVTFVETTTF